MIMQLIKEPIILARHVSIWMELVTYCCVLYRPMLSCVYAHHQQTYFVFLMIHHNNANHVFLLILIFQVLHNKAAGETNKRTDKPSPVVFLRATFKLNSISLPFFFWVHGRGLMYVCVCAVAGGGSVDEILFPCKIKASAAVSVSHNAPVSQTLRRDEEVKDGHAEWKRQGFQPVRWALLPHWGNKWRQFCPRSPVMLPLLMLLYKMDSMTTLGV